MRCSDRSSTGDLRWRLGDLRWSAVICGYLRYSGRPCFEISSERVKWQCMSFEIWTTAVRNSSAGHTKGIFSKGGQLDRRNGELVATGIDRRVCRDDLPMTGKHSESNRATLVRLSFEARKLHVAVAPHFCDHFLTELHARGDRQWTRSRPIRITSEPISAPEPSHATPFSPRPRD